MGVVKAAKERYLLVSKAEVFVDIILSELEQLSVKAAKKKKKLAIRINDGGDFYDKAYLMKWLKIAAQSPNITFYAYTKEVALLKSVELPNNFIVAYSFGGKQDHLISESDRHALIFKSTYALKKAGYANASEDDTKVFGKNLKIGLVEH
jgi:hypothetical protein